jgi:photosystem II stability/assembly factor-like uncharacterized protein
MDGATIRESTDGGVTWTSVTTSNLPIVALDLTSPTSATGVAVDSGCAGFKTNCWSNTYLVFTTDGGRTWSRS